jgi:hypothetical protein
MPYGDGTGPAGMGPMTGRAAGYCAGFGVPGYMNSLPGRGFGRGFGFGRGGRGRRNWFYATGLTGWQRAAFGFPFAGPYPPFPSKDQELEFLKEQAKSMQSALESLQKQINDLEASEKPQK